MKILRSLLLIIICFQIKILAQPNLNFDNYFLDKTMRIDYFHIGDAKNEKITIDKIYKYGIWAGSKKNLIDNFNNGEYYIKIYDSSSSNIIFSKGFGTLFYEYQSSEKALNGIERTFSESALIPYPKNKIQFSIEKRDKENKLHEIFSVEIDPNDISIISENIFDNSVKIFKSLYNGDPHSKIDIAIIGEGYTEKEQSKFKSDLEKFTNIFFSYEPYKSYKDKFNIYGVFKPSQESGTDEPRANIFKNTLLSTTFNSLGSERYLMTEDNKALRNVAANVPYDDLYIMVNHKRYGGGGIYNLYCAFTSDNQWSPYLFTHEFGHSFAGLADEYYTSDVAYNDFFKTSIEPVEPNITALLDPENIKWKNLLTPGIEIPTPWEKSAYDSMDYKWQAERRKLNNKIAALKKNKAPQDEIIKAEEEYNTKDKAHAEKMEKYLKNSKYYGKVGVFEGGGYMPKGIYRPMLDCIMFNKTPNYFCKVCEQAIIEIIKFYSE